MNSSATVSHNGQQYYSRSQRTAVLQSVTMDSSTAVSHNGQQHYSQLKYCSTQEKHLQDTMFLVTQCTVHYSMHPPPPPHTHTHTNKKQHLTIEDKLNKYLQSEVLPISVVLSTLHEVYRERESKDYLHSRGMYHPRYY